MKYRVKFQCYWYNTGAADNHYYDNYEDFDTIQEAKMFAERVRKQKAASNSTNVFDWNNWKDSGNLIEVENGFISGEPTIVKHFQSYEESI